MSSVLATLSVLKKHCNFKVDLDSVSIDNFSKYINIWIRFLYQKWSKVPKFFLNKKFEWTLTKSCWIPEKDEIQSRPFWTHQKWWKNGLRAEVYVAKVPPISKDL